MSATTNVRVTALHPSMLRHSGRRRCAQRRRRDSRRRSVPPPSPPSYRRRLWRSSHSRLSSLRPLRLPRYWRRHMLHKSQRLQCQPRRCTRLRCRLLPPSRQCARRALSSTKQRRIPTLMRSSISSTQGGSRAPPLTAMRTPMATLSRPTTHSSSTWRKSRRDSIFLTSRMATARRARRSAPHAVSASRTLSRQSAPLRALTRHGQCARKRGTSAPNGADCYACTCRALAVRMGTCRQRAAD
mmetsp:Transcript_14202/g.43575  ORF Transcript_14202/g.43575 Transcript_14202/m.43575 type:complete len:242 (-) Transcript_14202:3265-3990(-)